MVNKFDNINALFEELRKDTDSNDSDVRRFPARFIFFDNLDDYSNFVERLPNSLRVDILKLDGLLDDVHEDIWPTDNDVVSKLKKMNLPR